MIRSLHVGLGHLNEDYDVVEGAESMRRLPFRGGVKETGYGGGS